ncbi:MAG: hypothetical protein ACRDL5_17450 [Solirubrobacteraceae bacterium]
MELVGGDLLVVGHDHGLTPIGAVARDLRGARLPGRPHMPGAQILRLWVEYDGQDPAVVSVTDGGRKLAIREVVARRRLCCIAASAL